MEENISETSGFMRLALGTGLTAMGASHLAKENGNKWLGFTFLVCGAMKVAEGIFLYCPLKAMINTNVKDAMTSTIEDFLDGDSLMTAFSSLYQNSNNTGSSASSKSSSSSSKSSGSGSSAQNLSEVVSNVAKTVSEATPTGTPVNTAAKAAAQTLSNANNQNNQKSNTTH